jgi:translin
VVDRPDDVRVRLESVVASIVDDLSRANAGREAALPACRRVIQLAGSAIKAVHRLELDEARGRTDECEAILRTAQAALANFPSLQHAGFLHDAEKEYVEARVTLAFVTSSRVPDQVELGVEPTSWMRGVAEAASEMRRHLLDRLREGDVARAEHLLTLMDDAYDALIVVDFPDALTGGLRRTLDALRAVLERSRGDLTTTAVQSRLQVAIESLTDGGSKTLGAAD